MRVQENLIEIYNRHGFKVSSGSGFNRGSIQYEFTQLLRGEDPISSGWGMGFFEINLLEFVGAIWKPSRIFGVGVAFGWSTVALRFIFPDAKIAAIDAGTEGDDNLEGIRLTRAILGEISSAEVTIKHGFSPEGTGQVVEENLDGRIDFAFIDGLHTNDQQMKDYLGIKPYLSQDHLILFHDVAFCNLRDSFAAIGKDYPDRAFILNRTTSGIGMVFSPSMQYRAQRLVRLFDGQPV